MAGMGLEWAGVETLKHYARFQARPTGRQAVCSMRLRAHQYSSSSMLFCSESSPAKPWSTPAALQRPSPMCFPPMVLLCAQGLVQVMDMLLREGQDASTRDADGRTALHLAAMSGKANACAALILFAAKCEPTLYFRCYTILYCQSHTLFYLIPW